MLSRINVSIKGEKLLQYDIKEWKIESYYDPTVHVVNFVKMIQLEDVYGNIGHACCIYGKFIFNANILKGLPLKKTSLNIICGNDNDNDINK